MSTVKRFAGPLDETKFRDLLVAVRKDWGVSDELLARIAGVSVHTLRRWRRGEQSPNTLKMDAVRMKLLQHESVSGSQ